MEGKLQPSAAGQRNVVRFFLSHAVTVWWLVSRITQKPRTDPIKEGGSSELGKVSEEV